jgi:peptidoglycan hydrolase-like protein with peptidoglycan-binding domain
MAYNFALSYLIGADEDRIKSDSSRLIEGPYDAPPLNNGQDIAYCNLFHENRDEEGPIYAPYLADDDTSSEYGEGRINPLGKGWRKNLDRQYELRRSQGHTCIELDNPDSYDAFYFNHVMKELDICGFDVVAKNPVILDHDHALAYVSHPKVIGMIIEKNDLSPQRNVRYANELRISANKPTLPIWFVTFNPDGLEWAEKIAKEATGYKSIGVTNSKRGEYITAEDVFPFNGEQTMPGWRVAKSLLHLREQVNAKSPNRDKSSDGTIGDASHASRSSDHNPWVTDGSTGVVTAMDISNDPKHKVVSRDIAETLRTSRDPRLKYVISNAQIFSSDDWKWRRYSGPNPHTAHCHISVKATKALYDKVDDWTLPASLDGLPSKPLNDIVSAVSLGDMAHTGEQSERVRLIQKALKAAGSWNAVDGDFGPKTEASVKWFQDAKDLQVDGIVGPATAAELDKYLTDHPPPPIPEKPAEVVWDSGKGSWYSQYEGRYDWNDPGDKAGSNALRVPDDAQGISFFNSGTLGRWFEVQYPNGKKFIEQQTDIGPAPWTGKKIDISAAAAERAGYSPDNFPTGAIIKWRGVDPPDAVKNMASREAAVKYRDARKMIA